MVRDRASAPFAPAYPRFAGRLTALLLLAWVSACAPAIHPGLAPTPVTDQSASTAPVNGLTWRAWPAKGGPPKAIILGLHGFNDYARTFRLAGPWLADQGITLLAYDQRGFGQTGKDGGNWGQWPGAEALVSDARLSLATIKQQNPGVPVFLMGHSMGAAVALSALAGQDALADGLILVAPATWGGENLNPIYRAGLWLGAHLLPRFTMTGRGLGRVASDNRAFLIENGRDPLFIKDTRIDTVYGLTGLMGQAAAVAPNLTTPTLILTGAKDEIIPPWAQIRTAQMIPAACDFRWAPDGWHMLLADTSRAAVFTDIAAFILRKLPQYPFIPCRNAALPA